MNWTIIASCFSLHFNTKLWTFFFLLHQKKLKWKLESKYNQCHNLAIYCAALANITHKKWNIGLYLSRAQTKITQVMNQITKTHLLQVQYTNVLSWVVFSCFFHLWFVFSPDFWASEKDRDILVKYQRQNYKWNKLLFFWILQICEVCLHACRCCGRPLKMCF